MYYFKIIPFALIDRPLIYKCKEKIKRGKIVEISVRKKELIGVVLSEIASSEITFDKKKIIEISKLNFYSFKPTHIEFIEYLSKHYFIELGMSFKISIGSDLNLKKQLKKYLLFDHHIYENKKILIGHNKLSPKKFLVLQNEKQIIETELGFKFYNKKDNIELNSGILIIYNK